MQAVPPLYGLAGWLVQVLRLLMYGSVSDLACGLDLYLEPEPFRDPASTAVRRELTFYDTWVARDLQGQRFQWGPPFVQWHPPPTPTSMTRLQVGREGGALPLPHFSLAAWLAGCLALPGRLCSEEEGSCLLPVCLPDADDRMGCVWGPAAGGRWGGPG